MAGRQIKPLLGITMGDPCGIGPEVILRALADRRARSVARFLVFGSAAMLARVAEAHDLRPPPWKVISAAHELNEGRGPFFLECTRCPDRLALLGRPTAAGGRASVACIESALTHALNGSIDAMVTAPINKAAVHRGGHAWPGHTELLAARTGTKKPVMMMVGDELRAALVTTHAAIADLPRLITRKNVLETIRVTHRGLRQYFGLRKPRLSVCGLNPHAGEGGRFGREEIRAIAPAVRRARAEGIACHGPHPADVAFIPAHLARCDAVIAMFHDQATIPVKMRAFDRGVNVTLGLPIIRTSPDHGTAYDIVRRGAANPGSMVAAILLAAEMAKRRRAEP